jgi:multiple sugar transport system substrate-binding protein
MPRLVLVLFVALLAMAPLGVRAAGLVVWWEKGFYPQEDEAVAEIIAAFEQDAGKQVELVQFEQDEILDKAQAAVLAENPPGFLFGQLSERYVPRWAYEDRLVDLHDALAPVLDLFDADAIEVSTLLNGSTGKRDLYALPMGRTSNHVHVWVSLLERAGLSLDDIPKEWEAFWSFWCDRVQPAVRQAAGREDVWGIGVPMSLEAYETWLNFRQFMIVYGADYVTRDGRVVIDDPQVRQNLVRAINSYTAIYRKGCTPPDSATWDGYGNNKAFLPRPSS